MSGPPRVRSTNIAEAEPPRPVLRPAGNNAPSINSRKPASKPSKKSAEKPQQQEPDAKDKKVISSPSGPRKLGSVRAVLQQQEMKVGSNLAMNASCSSDASSSDSSHSRASSGKLVRRNSGIVSVRRKQCSPKAESVDCVVGLEKVEAAPEDCGGVESIDGLEGKKRCPWVTANSDPNYAAFHDEEWGVPVHDDKKLFELLCLSGALAELTWPSILTKRHIFREVFLDFDPVAVSKLNEKKIVAQGGPASALLSEPKVRAILENARQFCKVIEEFGSFNKYIWNFVNNKPSVSQFRYPRQVPVKSSKAEFISKDLVRRGFRSVGPTVVYSFMQVAGLTNDHLISCFRFHECIAGEELAERNQVKAGKTEARKHRETTGLGLSKLK
ncbi:uncharacterized protein LOC116199468 [Punica granatum]|uniref:Uncharacterized protein LOC116199468 n=2 Tax=Punica granatum TaxID=22663 RepID=A0A6P8CU94_PUNGR|nr:uncharacterized protein LOC116199468 [Punica granatum]PKI40820.1 hypothetical protein CRG98_038831 [Punica granatum]